jgi:hypothetical protein
MGQKKSSFFDGGVVAAAAAVPGIGVMIFLVVLVGVVWERLLYLKMQ